MPDQLNTARWGFLSVHKAGGMNLNSTCVIGLDIFNVHRSVHRNNILIYIQQDATLHSLF